MQVPQVQTIIARKYKMISRLMEMNMPAKDANTAHIWGVNLIEKGKLKGHVGQMGDIDLGSKTKVTINKDTDIVELTSKSCLSTSSRALKKVNSFLDKVLTDFNNPEVVKQNFVKVHLWPEKLVDNIIAAQEQFVKSVKK